VSALLVGQAPSRTTGRPWASDAGRRLARHMGTTHDALLRAFRPRNLNAEHPGAVGKYDRFDLDEARATARHMLRYVIPRYDVALVCGVATARCLGMEAPGVARVGRCTVYAIPHPAGTSMWWNDPENRETGALLAREAWLHAGEAAR